jgi:ribosomal protein S18 acetylase RimI-like enzyme
VTACASERYRRYAYISDLVVLPPHGQGGLGRKLLERAEAFACEHGAKKIRVGVLASNRLARSLYRQMGFSEYQLQLVKVL